MALMVATIQPFFISTEGLSCHIHIQKYLYKTACYALCVYIVIGIRRQGKRVHDPARLKSDKARDLISSSGYYVSSNIFLQD